MNDFQISQKIQKEREQYRFWARYVRIGSFDIAGDHFQEFESKLTGLNRKTEKYGTLPIVWKVLGSRVKTQAVFADPTDVHPERRKVLVHRVVLFGETPRIAGWEFAATIQHVTEGENIVREIPGGSEVPSRFFSVPPVCDHCGTKRIRKDTYIVRNLSSGEWKQVGKSCLGDFTGTKNPEKVANWAKFLDDVLLVSRGFSSRQGSSWTFETVSFLAAVAARSMRDGYISRTMASDKGFSLTTADLVWDDMIQTVRKEYGESVHTLDGLPLPEVTGAHVQKAKDVLDWVRSGMGMDERNRDSFHRNLIATLRVDHVTSRERGFAAAAFQSFQKFQERQNPGTEKVSEYQGKIGEKINVSGLKLVFLRDLPGNYGVTWLHKFEDENGNIYVWFSSSEALEMGKVYSGKGTVKNHDEFAGKKQTVLTRCKLTGEGENPNPPKVKPGDVVRVQDRGWGTEVTLLWKNGSNLWEVKDQTGQNRFYRPQEFLELLRREEKSPIPDTTENGLPF